MMERLNQAYQSVRWYLFERGRIQPRRKVTGAERFICIVILVGIIGVGAFVALKGQRYNPRLYALDESVLSETMAQADAPSAIAFPQTADGTEWKRSNVENYNASNLYEKINGRAELYLSYDVVALHCTSYTPSTDTDDDGDMYNYVDVFVYDMGAPLNAFGIYSYENVGGGKPVNIGREGYEAAGSIYFWKGRYYVQVVVPMEDPELARIARKLAKAIDRQLKDEPVEIWGISAFPPDGLVEGSITFIKRNALQFDFLNELYTARYEYEGEIVKAFLSKRNSPQEAKQILEKWKGALSSYGEILEEMERNGEPWFVGKIGDMVTVAFCKGNILGGVTEVSDKESAKNFAQSLFERLREE
ncbi:MAG TPA: hypothetical protein EYP10_03635 [Armatimonadetes bacterium]|nr:hypothetical protein [Armatimonadota bacterium]